MKATYAYLYANCAELYDRELASEHLSLDPNVRSGPKNLDFWPKLISLVVSVIEEDRGVYTQVLNQYGVLLFSLGFILFHSILFSSCCFLFMLRFPSELNVGVVSSEVFWNMFSSDLQEMLKGKTLILFFNQSHEYGYLLVNFS